MIISVQLGLVLSMFFARSARAFPRSVSTTAFTSSVLSLASSSTSSRRSTTTARQASTMAEASVETTSTSYTELLDKLDTITQLGRVKSILGYDQLVFMPPKASAARGAQMSALAAVLHEKTTDPALKELIEAAAVELEDSDDLDAKRLVELERKAFIENERVPAALASKAAALGSSAYSAWVEAKTANDFEAFAPVLADCFDTSMELASAKRGDRDVSLYTQMLDEFEMGMSQERIDEIFGSIQEALVPLIQQVLSSPDQPSTKPLEGSFDIDTQKALCEEIVTKMGYDPTFGRIDVSVHPFTSSSSPSDVRITSRYRESEWYQGLAAMIHESGHAMYEQNMGAKGSTTTSLESALSMGIHESQSLFWERHVSLGMPFWKWATPLLQSHFPDAFSHTTPEQMYGAVNAVKQSLIRVEADELTYPLHVILRYGIEKDVIGGKLQVKDIPARWNKDCKEMLHVDVPDDANGCLQDIHWASLAFGYFPTYLIGSATAAQLAHYCRQDLNMDELIETGDFGPIKEWLTSKVHRHGRRYESLDALLEAQLGEPLNPKYFIDYLQEKYTALYKL